MIKGLDMTKFDCTEITPSITWKKYWKTQSPKRPSREELNAILKELINGT